MTSRFLSPACGCGVHRRRVLRGAVGAACLPLAAHAAEPGPSPELIDVHHHVIPPFWFEEVKEHIAAQGGGRIVPNWYGWTPERALREMDQNGVRKAMVSISAPGVWFGDAGRAADLTRRCNAYMAELARSKPDRFGVLASLPYPDPQRSLQELAHAYDELKVDGVGLFTSYGDKWLGDPAFWPVLEALNARKAVVYVHPVSPQCCTALMSYVPPFLTEFTQDTNRAILSVIYSGAAARFPDIRFIFSHAGGTLPMLAGRITQLAPSVQALRERTPDGLEPQLRRFFYEVANSANRGAVGALRSVVPSSQVLFGSDFPLVPIPATAGGLARLGLPTGELAELAHANAERLFGRSGA
jgi:predicted TIM-barrel fold metal-dependent hydrolase